MRTKKKSMTSFFNRDTSQYEMIYIKENLARTSEVVQVPIFIYGNKNSGAQESTHSE